jgi:hypothetical protein
MALKSIRREMFPDEGIELCINETVGNESFLVKLGCS